jgi:REP element-mobilizing transposase RayT
MATTFPLDATCFGGSLLRSNPKRERPLQPHKGLHLILRSKIAKGKNSLMYGSHIHKIRKIIERQAQTFDIGIYRISVNSNHVHVLVRLPRLRENYRAFVRAIAGLIVRLVLRVERGQAKKIKFWSERPFSRIINLGQALRACARYIDRNILEASGLEGINHTLAYMKTAPYLRV